MQLLEFVFQDPGHFFGMIITVGVFTIALILILEALAMVISAYKGNK